MLGYCARKTAKRENMFVLHCGWTVHLLNKPPDPSSVAAATPAEAKALPREGASALVLLTASPVCDTALMHTSRIADIFAHMLMICRGFL